MNNKLTALIDGDLVVYKAGFSVEPIEYEVLDSKGKVICTERYMEDVKKFIKRKKLKETDYTIEKMAIIEPLSHALRNAKSIIKKILTQTKADDYIVYLSGEKNFREGIATIQGYKANRDPNDKPYHYEKIKQYLIKIHDAVVVDGQEADDAMGIDQCSNLPEKITNKKGQFKTVICSADKDMKTIPGLHFDWTKEEPKIKFVSETKAAYNFYKQILTGDVADNVKGLENCGENTIEKYGLRKGRGCGEVAATKILEEVQHDPELMEQRVYEAFLDWEFKLAEGKDIHPERVMHEAQRKMTENGQLLYIRHKPDEMWSMR